MTYIACTKFRCYRGYEDFTDLLGVFDSHVRLDFANVI